MIALLLLACLDRSGTAVGNPGQLGIGATDVPAGVTLRRAEVDAPRLVFLDCGTGVESFDVEGTFDLLAPYGRTVAAPGGEWCRLEVLPAPLLLEGETAGGTTFSITLAPSLAVVGPFVVDGGRLLLELPLAEVLDPEALEALGEDVVLAPEDPAADALEVQLAEEVSLYQDVDQDGTASPEEPVLAVAGDNDAAPAPHDEAACGCGGRTPTPAWGLAAFLLLVLGRRRTRRT